MRDKLRCGVIGAGGIGLDHLNSLLHCPRAAAVAVAESHPQRLREATERYHVPRGYADWRELLDQPDLDAVTIALPNHLHASVAIAALQARKHVLLEKPMATNARDAAKILAAAQKSRRTVMVAQNFRFDAHTQAARALIQRGDLGEVYHARCFWLRQNHIPRIGSWFTQKQFAGGGSTCDLGVHLLDACLHLLDEFKVVSVSAQTHAKFGPRGRGDGGWGKSEIDFNRTFDVEDQSAAFLRLKSGRSVILETSWAGFHPADGREFGMDLLGTEAGLSLYPAKLYRNGPNGYETTHLQLPKPAVTQDRVHHFVHCVLDGKKTLVPPEESLQIQHTLAALYASAASGREVRLK